MGENSLLQKVFKQRYFPRSSIWDDKPGFAPSYIWRSIIGTKDLIFAGSKWSIGNGESVKIWGTNWVPGCSFSLASAIDA